MGRNVLSPGPARRARPKPGHTLALNRLEDRITPALGTFELDGNATTQATHDWDQVYNDAVVNPGQNTSGSIPGAPSFIHDPVNSATDDIFTGGSSTDINDVSQWQWNAGHAAGQGGHRRRLRRRLPGAGGRETHTIINFGADRYDNVGSTTIGFWFFQNRISKNANGTFSGAHTVGDIFVVADSSSGVATFNAVNGSGRAAPQGSLQLLTTDPSNVFATVNTANTPSGGWPFRTGRAPPRQHLRHRGVLRGGHRPDRPGPAERPLQLRGSRPATPLADSRPSRTS